MSKLVMLTKSCVAKAFMNGNCHRREPLGFSNEKEVEVAIQAKRILHMARACLFPSISELLTPAPKDSLSYVNPRMRTAKWTKTNSKYQNECVDTESPES